MVRPGLKRIWRYAWKALPYVALLTIAATSLYLLSDATQDETRFGVSYTGLLVFNTLALLVLLVVIGDRLVHLLRQRRAGEAGARLTSRLLFMFLALVLPAVLAVYLFSLHLLYRNIDSWVDVQVEAALDDALELGQIALNARLRDVVAETQEMARDNARSLAEDTGALAALTINALQRDSTARQIALLDITGRVIASTPPPPGQMTPEIPGESVLLQLRQGERFYAGVEPVGDDDLQMRVVVRVPQDDAFATPRILQAVWSAPAGVARLAGTVEAEVDEYRTTLFLRTPLKYSLTITLSVVLLFAVFLAVLAAFVMARRLVAPVRRLAEATRAVAAGDYRRRLEVPSSDELGSLVRSFNIMTGEIARASELARLSQEEVEGQRAYLEAILGRLSSGVLALDDDHIVRTVNEAASGIVGASLKHYVGRPLASLNRELPFLSPLTERVLEQARTGQREWQQQVVLFGAQGRRVLMCRGTSLRPGGHVLVFDDVTALIQSQRDAAWGEMARRLAHEVRNPLTPIQLAAERLRHKFLQRMDRADASVLDRATHTIVQQVEALKKLVNAFNEYARAPKLQREPVLVGQLVREVAELYRGEETDLQVDLDLSDGDRPVMADSGRLRQVLHNLFRNAVEAVAGRENGMIRVSTAFRERGDTRYLELRVEDNGPGFPEELLDRLFEPYVTTKFKGTGLGLAIVQKIVEEHDGIIRVGNADHGAWVEIQIPLIDAAATRAVETG